MLSFIVLCPRPSELSRFLVASSCNYFSRSTKAQVWAASTPSGTADVPLLHLPDREIPTSLTLTQPFRSPVCLPRKRERERTHRVTLLADLADDPQSSIPRTAPANTRPARGTLTFAFPAHHLILDAQSKRQGHQVRRCTRCRGSRLGKGKGVARVDEHLGLWH